MFNERERGEDWGKERKTARISWYRQLVYIADILCCILV
jgi:hypothetical protein